MFNTPYMPQFQQFPNYPQPTPMMQPQQQPQQPDITVGTCATIEQVEQVQLMPNERKIIVVQNQPVIAMRTADNMGLVTTKYHQLVEFDPRATAQPQQQAEYATLAVVQELQMQIASLSTELENLKGVTKNDKPPVKRNGAADS